MIEIQHATLAYHGVIVELLLKALPQLHRPFVERLVAGQAVIGTNDGGIATGIAPTDPALFQHCNIRDAMHGGQIIGRREAVASASDYDDIISAGGRRIPPNRRPAAMTEGGIRQKGKD